MNKITSFLSTFILCIFFASSAFAALGGSIGIGTGLGGVNKGITPSVTVVGELEEIGLLLGGEIYTDISFFSGSASFNNGYQDYNFYLSGGEEVGFSFLAGYKFNKYFGLLAGVGTGITGGSNFNYSNGGLKYYQNSATAFNLEFSGQVLFQYKYLMVQAGYSYRRGVTVSIGFMR